MSDCTCNADAYSLNPAEVVVHRTGGPCTIEPVGHECTFIEEQEPSGRLVLPPCLTCGLTAMDALQNLTAGVNDGPGGLLPPGADDAPDESKGDAASPPASHPAPAVTRPASSTGGPMSTAYCFCGGVLRHWKGTDGHGGTEWFSTCQKCGKTI